MKVSLPHTPLRSLALALACLITISAAPAPSEAQSAKALLRRGNQLFAKGEYQEAKKVLEQALEKHRGPDILRTLAYCLVKVRWYADALKRFKDYLAENPTAKDRAKIEQVMQHLEVVVRTKLTVRSKPMGATVFIDAEAAGPVGTTPYVGRIEPGQHVVILKKEGFRPVARAVQVKPKQAVDLRVPLEVDLKVTSNPEGATVHLDAETAPALGRTPLQAGITPGRHTVYVRLPGFATFHKTVSVAAARPVTLSAALYKKLSIRSIPPGARVRIDGKPRSERTPLDLLMPPGEYTIELDRPGFNPFRQRVQVTAGSSGVFTGRLHGDGLLSIRSDPAGATVRVGAMELGKTPLSRVSVPLGEREVTLSYPGRSAWDEQLLFRKDDLVSARVKLGRRSWPTWVLVGVAGLAAIIGTATGVAALDRSKAVSSMLVEERDANGRPTGRLAVGACTAEGQPIFTNMWDANRGEQANDPCSLGLQHTSTAFLSVAGASALSALLYYLIFVRPSDAITRGPR
jgi:hypothetical protein